MSKVNEVSASSEISFPPAARNSEINSVPSMTDLQQRQNQTNAAGRCRRNNLQTQTKLGAEQYGHVRSSPLWGMARGLLAKSMPVSGYSELPTQARPFPRAIH